MHTSLTTYLLSIEQFNSYPSSHVDSKLSKSLPVPRTKSAQNKRKSESELSTNLLTITDIKEKKQKKKQTSIQFVVNEDGGHQGHKYFGLIAGMGGGEGACIISVQYI